MFVRPMALLASLAAAFGCAHGTPSTQIGGRSSSPAPCDDAPFGSDAPFDLDRRALLAERGARRLVETLDGSVYRYFRMLGPQMAARTCRSLRDVRWHLPLIAVHGDAHVEQFVVTPTTAGLEDFDQSGYGPSAVDLVRYAASVHLTCREVSWPCNADAAVDVFLRAYHDALDRPPDETIVPSIVARLRQSAPHDRAEWLTWAERLMVPLPADIEPLVRQRWESFAHLVAEIQPQRPPAFCRIKKLGALQMGVGSLLEHKILFRVEGDTDAPEDDFILEGRAAPASTGRDCAWRPPHGNSLHALLMMSILGRRMPEVYGFGALSDEAGSPEYWVQSWVPGYRELAIADVQSQTELEELAADAARQLAGHMWTRFPEALRAHQRRAQLHAFDLVQERVRALARDLASEVVAAWVRFRGRAADAQGR
jgi:hypothetical protein